MPAGHVCLHTRNLRNFLYIPLQPHFPPLFSQTIFQLTMQGCSVVEQAEQGCSVVATGVFLGRGRTGVFLVNPE
jgi:hypothetical protein